MSWLLLGAALAADPIVVKSVYDGDTFTLSDGQKVRLRWVNTPELSAPTEAYAIEARELTASLVSGQEVKLSTGPSPRDAYGRLVAGVKVGEVDLQASLLEAGLAHLFVIPPDETDLSAYVAAEERARAARRGIWSDARYQGELHITSFHANADGDDRQNPNGEYLRVCNVSGHTVDLAGYTLSDLSGRSWTLPALVLPPGHTVKIHSGSGRNESDPRSQLTIYLGSAEPIWNNQRDRATLTDRYKKVADSLESSGDGRP